LPRWSRICWRRTQPLTLSEIDQALRDTFAQSHLIAGPGKTFQVVTGGMPALLAAAGVTADINRAALAAKPLTAT
jgi:hypothetical protein